MPSARRSTGRSRSHATMVDQENNEAMRRMTQFRQQQNEQVKKVSSGWVAILFAPTLVGTIYGRTSSNMPERRLGVRVPHALALMLATSLTLYACSSGRAGSSGCRCSRLAWPHDCLDPERTVPAPSSPPAMPTGTPRAASTPASASRP